MSKKYRLTFEFVETEEEARVLTTRYNRDSTKYMRENKPSHYTPWEARDAEGNVTESKFIVWHWV